MAQTATTVPTAPPTGVRRKADVAFAALTVLFTAAVVMQVFLAGLGVFGINGTDVEDASSLDPHRALGNALGILAGVLLVLALVARASRRVMLGTLLLVLLTEVAQHGLAQLGAHHAWAGGLHAADGLLILAVGGWLAVDARRRTRAAR